MLDWVPAQPRAIRIARPKYACRVGETVAQASVPERLIAGGLATPGLLAQVLGSKYCDHTPLNRQSQIVARNGADLARSSSAGWVGGACWWLEASHERLARNVFASDIYSPTIRSPTTRRFRCSIGAAGAPRRGGCRLCARAAAMGRA
ncbi:MAG: IS66 family transposase [Mesorhizobium sp.]|nr:MAG: IS66 family transposase [Mesorhizobium sp.]